MYRKYVSVVLDVKLDKILEYSVPEDLSEAIEKGKRVKVPLRGHTSTGYIYEVKEKPSFPKVLPILEVITEHAVLTKELFELALWITQFYNCSLSRALKVMTPTSVRKQTREKTKTFVRLSLTKKKAASECANLRSKYPARAKVLDVMLKVKKGIFLTELVEKSKTTQSTVKNLEKMGILQLEKVATENALLANATYFPTKPKQLNKDQSLAFEKIQNSLEKKQFETHLLFGVTGSGKTEIYMQAIEKAVAMDLGVIVLVPEISLTQQTIERFLTRFDAPIALLHHRISGGQRVKEWQNIQSGKTKIVIGARSAIFSPMQNLGLIIVDEEHEASYKQTEEMPCYHARDVAVMLAKMTNATVILGSATPSLESFLNAKKGKYTLSTLGDRAGYSKKAPVTIVDMKKEFEKSGFTNFSNALLTGIKKRHATGEQTILFLNRRGYHTTFFCKACAKPLNCPHCAMSLTYHLSKHALTCHLCGYTHCPPPKICPICKRSAPIKYLGVGTELLERSLHALFPEIRTCRIDADTTKAKGSHQKLLRHFGTGKADVLIGTQMIAKGLHFPQVTLVGIINCDTALNIPDFRSSETVFQLITQVAGRSGRGQLPGEVILQTAMPNNSTILHAANQDYLSFYSEEITTREIFHYPPLSQMVKIVFSSKNEEMLIQTGTLIQKELVKRLPKEYEILPLMPSYRTKIKDKYRYQCLIKGANIYQINSAIQSCQKDCNRAKIVKILIDVNPLSTF